MKIKREEGQSHFDHAAIHLYVQVVSLQPNAVIGTVSTAPAPDASATGLS